MKAGTMAGRFPAAGGVGGPAPRHAVIGTGAARRLPARLGGVLLAVFFVTGCSIGRVYRPDPPAADALACDLPGLAPDDVDRSNTLFVQPGMVLVSQSWDRSPAVETADRLVKEGYAAARAIVRERDVEVVYEHMMADPGTQFLGIHYSLGGNARLLAATFAAARRASAARGEQLRYHAIVADPYELDGLEGLVDLQAPEVGQLAFLYSKEGALLRGSVSALTPAVLASPKVNVVYAEDVRTHWAHFTILPSWRPAVNARSAAEGERTLALIRRLAAMSLASRSGDPGREIPLACLKGYME